MSEFKGAQSNMYQDNMFYEVEVVDLLSPTVESFVVGLNGKISSYPTHKTIRIPGSEIKVIMDATIPEEKYEMDNGFRRVVGIVYRSRFSVSMKQFGTFPTAKATVLQPFGSYAVHLDAGKSLQENGNVASPEDIEMMAEPKAEAETPKKPSLKAQLEARREELEGETKDVLEAHAESLGLVIPARNSKSTFVDRILEAERKNALAEE